ncbi:hypothetical protein K443DRAFT_224012 [Laccaria amethystina LaAM-08-1]|uniref:Unplaced genomic scaffold K443scaffold_144, whole genome shotgun sequence n=1 Tax=Laccaria amethystina LaAM-08-1 TaxID=1095629 RepID=A0A0C9XKC1_9AGAR|nr:hypothetical protein K443DRAFT_224012 [Laccaria amethystina LaAM-08-1]
MLRAPKCSGRQRGPSMDSEPPKSKGIGRRAAKFKRRKPRDDGRSKFICTHSTLYCNSTDKKKLQELYSHFLRQTCEDGFRELSYCYSARSSRTYLMSHDRSLHLVAYKLTARTFVEAG